MINIAELHKRFKPIFEEVCGDMYDTTKFLWQMGLTYDECLINKPIGVKMKYNKVVDDLIIKDKDLFKDHVKHIAKSIIEESPHIRYGQAVFNYVDEKYGVARIAQFDYDVDCFYDDTKIEPFLDKCYELIKTVNIND